MARAELMDFADGFTRPPRIGAIAAPVQAGGALLQCAA